MDVTPADEADDEAGDDERDARAQRRPGMTAAALIAIAATCQLFARVGREFCSSGGDDSSGSGSGSSSSGLGGGFDGSGRLEGCLRSRAKLFFAASHAKRLSAAKELAARDTWARCRFLALPPPPAGPTNSRRGANRGRSLPAAAAPGGGSGAGEGWDTGVAASDVASTVRVLTAAPSDSPKGGGSPLACSAQQHAAVRRLVAARRPILKWPPALQRLPAVCEKQNKKQKTKIRASDNA
jgi:hypothetical protein